MEECGDRNTTAQRFMPSAYITHLSEYAQLCDTLPRLWTVMSDTPEGAWYPFNGYGDELLALLTTTLEKLRGSFADR